MYTHARAGTRTHRQDRQERGKSCTRRIPQSSGTSRGLAPPPRAASQPGPPDPRVRGEGSARLLPRRSQARNSVGRGSDGLVQFEVQAGAAGVEAAVAGFADSAGLKELLAGNGHLLVTATGAEHVATIPCIRNRGEMEKKRSEGV